jgi:hypothetical protein
MQASHATAPILFMKDRILSALLLTCTRRSAEYALYNQINRFGSQWLNKFYDGLSLAIEQRSDFDIESRLTGAYIETSCKLGRDLSVEKLMLERSVRNILNDGLAAFRSTRWSEDAVARLNGEINCFVSQSIAIAPPPSGKITRGQMRDFIQLFLQELGRFSTILNSRY